MLAIFARVAPTPRSIRELVRDYIVALAIHDKLTCGAFQRWATIRNIHPTANLLGRDKTRKALSSDDARNSIPREERELSIREQLHLWTAETERKSALAIPPDASIYGRISNSLSRSHSTGSSELDQLKSLETGMSNDSSNQLANGDTEVNLVGNDSRSPGDLVELR